jgi:hypothetical protein
MGGVDSNFSDVLIKTLQVGVPFGAYFVGIIVRRIALPGRNSPKLPRQLLLGVPFSLAVVSPILTVFFGEIGNLPACLVTVRLIMEQGMLVNETATKFINEKAEAMINKRVSASQVPAPAE